MVRRALLALSLLAWGLSLGCSRPAPPEAETLVLRGFKLVDPATRNVTERELFVENGVIVARGSASKQHVIEGKGRWLMPALWDLRSALWGNNSTRSWDELTQDMSFNHALGVQLYYGVAHVGIFGCRRRWIERYFKRAEALGLSEAEMLYPDVGLCGKDAYGCEAVLDIATVRRVLDDRKRHRVPFVPITAGYHDSELGELGLRRDVLAESLKAARDRQLPTIVTVADWQQAEQVVELGASAVYGLPEGPAPDALVARMVDKDVAYAPALGMYLELDHVLGNERALSDPFLTATVQPAILDTYRNEQGLFGEWRRTLTLGRARRSGALAAVAQLAKAGVRIVATSDGNWAGTFQGHSSHALQTWYERAGLDGWTRLRAATLWPAQIAGRKLSFDAGAPADFLAVAADPLQSAQNLRHIALVIRRGKVVDRAKLLPDLERRDFRP
jgi:hypothetical protein